jgi:putative mRNA 3-end processing factor
VLAETPAGLYCAEGDFYIDPWGPVPRAVITHAHGDHARLGSEAYLCATDCAPLLARRFGPGVTIESLPYGQPVTLGSTRVSLHPAGHVLGSAQIRIEGSDGVWVVSGDYKRAPDPTCAPFEAVPCDTFVTESTFGLPIYRWDPTAVVIDEILLWWRENAGKGLTSIIFCYAIGKVQRLLAELALATDTTVPLIDKPRGTSFAGDLVLAPLSARGTPWMRRLGELSDGFASGLMRVRGVRRQRAYDRGFVISDHADWPALLQTIVETGASRVLATHGHAEPLARFLGEQGLASGVLRTAWEGETSDNEAPELNQGEPQ